MLDLPTPDSHLAAADNRADASAAAGRGRRGRILVGAVLALVVAKGVVSWQGDRGADDRLDGLYDRLFETYAGTTMANVERPDRGSLSSYGTAGGDQPELVTATVQSVTARYPVSYWDAQRCVIVTWTTGSVTFEKLADSCSSR